MPGNTTTSSLTINIPNGASILSSYSTSISQSNSLRSEPLLGKIEQRTTSAGSIIKFSSYAMSNNKRNMKNCIQKISDNGPSLSGSRILGSNGSQLREEERNYRSNISVFERLKGPNQPPNPYIPGDNYKRPPHVPPDLSPLRINQTKNNTIKPCCPHNDRGPITSSDIIEHAGNAEFGSAVRDVAEHPAVQKVVESTAEIVQNVLKTIGEEINKDD